MPYAFSRAGWVVGLPVLLVTVAQGVYTMLCLAECKRAISRPSVQDLGDVVNSALGVWGRRMSDLFVFIVQGGVCCCFVDLVAGSVAEELPFLGRNWVMLALAPLFGGMAMLREVAQLSGLNKLGIVAMFLAVVVGTSAGCRRLAQIGPSGVMAAALPERLVADAVMLAASIFFSFEGLGLILPIEKEMKKPTAFPKVVVLASSFLVATFISLTFTCGVAFRGVLETSIITHLAMNSSGMERLVMEISNIMVTAAVVVTFPLQLLPASLILSSWVAKARRRSGGSDGKAADEGGGQLLGVPSWLVQRLVLVASCMGLAAMVHNVALLVSLFGAIGQTGVGLLAPLCHMALMRRGTIPWSKRRLALNLFVVAFCLVVMFCGTCMAVADIVAAYR